MFSKARTHTVADQLAIDSYLARGGAVTICPPRRAHNRSDGGFNRLNDESRRSLGKAHD